MTRWKRIYTHAAKHIEQDGESSLKQSKMENETQLNAYIEGVFNDASYNFARYEIFSDAPRDRMAIWDNENSIVTIFNPKGFASDLNNGTVFKPKDGYDFMNHFKNGR